MAVLRDLNSLLTLQNEPPDSPHFLLLIYVGADAGFYHGFGLSGTSLSCGTVRAPQARMRV